MRQTIARIAIATLGLGLLVAQTLSAPVARAEFVEKEMSLPVRWQGWSHDYIHGSCFAAGLKDERGGTLVGFQHVSDCTRTILYEAVVVADIDSLKREGATNVLKASLDFKERHDYRMGSYANSFSCLAEMRAASAPVSPDVYPPTFDSGAMWQNPGSWNISSIMQTWFLGQAENHGLFLEGHETDAAFDDWEEDADSCVSEIYDIEIVVKFLAETSLDAGNVRAEKSASIIQGPGSSLQHAAEDDAPDHQSGPFTSRVHAEEVLPVASPLPKNPDTSDSSQTLMSATGQSGAQLTIEKVEIRGKNVRQGSDCDPGKNDVIVTVKNTNTGAATGIEAKLEVDGDKEAEKTIPELRAAASVDIEFDEIDLKKGDRSLKITLNPSGQGSDTVFERKVSCADE